MRDFSIQDIVKGLGSAVDNALNGENQNYGFVLIAFPFSDQGYNAHFTSNTDPHDVIDLLETTIAQIRKRLMPEGNA